MANSERRISFIFADSFLFAVERFRSINCETFRFRIFFVSMCARCDFMKKKKFLLFIYFFFCVEDFNIPSTLLICKMFVTFFFPCLAFGKKINFPL